jgi:hypothetical protein
MRLMFALTAGHCELNFEPNEEPVRGPALPYHELFDRGFRAASCR